jgi:hypothetical protein
MGLLESQDYDAAISNNRALCDNDKQMCGKPLKSPGRATLSDGNR